MTYNERPKRWYEILEDKYIQLFTIDKESKRPIRGIEAPEGWKRHIENFLESLEWHRVHNRRDDKDNDIKVFQIKEKFGQVRVYVDAPEHIYHMIGETIGRLEGKCSLTCQRCGKLEYDLVQTKGWVAFICKECAELKESTP